MRDRRKACGPSIDQFIWCPGIATTQLKKADFTRAVLDKE